jgi:hypothetical protein
MNDSATLLPPDRNSPRGAVAQIDQSGPQKRQKLTVSSLRQAERKMKVPMAYGYYPKLPIYSLRSGEVLSWWFYQDVEVMRIHPCIVQPLNYVMGPLHYAEWSIAASSKAAGIYGANLLQWYWQHALPQLQEEAYLYGWAAQEITYEDRDGLTWPDEVTTFSSRDVQVLVRGERKERVGIRVNGTENGYTDLWAFRRDVPNKGFWYSHQPRAGSSYGNSVVRPAWKNWRRLAGMDGVEEIIDLAAHRFGTGIVKVLHPNEAMPADEAGLPNYAINGEVHTRDVARFMAQQLKAGAGVSFPSQMWPTGGPKWDLSVESFNTNIDQLGAHEDRLYKQCSNAIGVSPELFEASETGSGYSGRAIPLQGFLLNQQKILSSMTSNVMKYFVEPLVHWCYGPSAWCRANPKPLLESVRKSSWDTPGDAPAGGGAAGPAPGIRHGPDGKFMPGSKMASMMSTARSAWHQQRAIRSRQSIAEKRRHLLANIHRMDIPEICQFFNQYLAS